MPRLVKSTRCSLCGGKLRRVKLMANPVLKDVWQNLKSVELIDVEYCTQCGALVVLHEEEKKDVNMS